jgi:hypothetical protein
MEERTPFNIEQYIRFGRALTKGIRSHILENIGRLPGYGGKGKFLVYSKYFNVIPNHQFSSTFFLQLQFSS